MTNVLSLFDGMSCGQVAFERAGIEVKNYYASEIDKHAIAVTQKNYPNTIQMGDVVVVREMAEAGLFGHIDYLIGGSPCQGFSFAGKQLAFDDPRSILFFEYVRILEALKKTNPEIKFLLENVKMKQEFLDVITNFLGVEPKFINSSLVSAQLRQRYYWANWSFEKPEDKNIKLKDIIKSGFVNRDKSLTIVARYIGVKGSQNYMRRRYFGKSLGQVVFEKNDIEEHKKLFKKEPYGDDESLGLIRPLSVNEIEILQNLPENYTKGINEMEAYKMLGNGWTVDVIAHILKGSVK